MYSNQIKIYYYIINNQTGGVKVVEFKKKHLSLIINHKKFKQKYNNY